MGAWHERAPRKAGAGPARRVAAGASSAAAAVAGTEGDGPGCESTCMFLEGGCAWADRTGGARAGWAGSERGRRRRQAASRGRRGYVRTGCGGIWRDVRAGCGGASRSLRASCRGRRGARGLVARSGDVGMWGLVGSPDPIRHVGGMAGASALRPGWPQGARTRTEGADRPVLLRPDQRGRWIGGGVTAGELRAQVKVGGHFVNRSELCARIEVRGY